LPALRVVIDIHTGEKPVIFEVGERIPIEDVTEWTAQIAKGERFEGLTIARHEADVVLTVTEAAKMTGRHENTILRWLDSGVVNGFKVSGRGTGGQWRIPMSEIESAEPPRPGPKPKEVEKDD